MTPEGPRDDADRDDASRSDADRTEADRNDADRNDELADSLDIDAAAQPRPEPVDPAPDARLADPPRAANPAPAAPGADAQAAAGAAATGTPPQNWLERRRERKRRKAENRRKAPWWELPALVVLAILIAIVVKTFVVQPFYIPSPSMERTLHGCTGCSGDRILVNKPIFDLRDPHPGDIVVFSAPTAWQDTLGEPVPTRPTNPIVRLVRGFGQLTGFVPPDDLVLVKRVIAVGGQTVKGIATPNGKDAVMVSDHGTAGPWRTLNEPFVYLDGPDSSAQFGPVTVPKGRLWVMGDHRNASADSRYHCGAGGNGPVSGGTGCNPVTSTVPVSDVIGKAFVIAWPPSRWRTLGTPSTFESAGASGAVPLAVLLPVFGLRRRRRRRQ